MEQHFFPDKASWLEARKGLFTSSEIHKLMTPGERKMTEDELKARPAFGKGSKTTFVEDENLLSDGAVTYIREKAAEILSETGQPFYDYNMQWGVDHEAEAAAAFAEWLGMSVNDPEFLYCGVSEPVFYTMANIAGGSPDLVIPDAIGEIKCPTSKIHLDHLLTSADTFRFTLPEKWIQCQANMLFTEKSLCYFISYDPRYSDKRLQLKIIEIPADVEYQTLIAKKLGLAKTLLDGLITQVFALNPDHVKSET